MGRGEHAKWQKLEVKRWRACLENNYHKTHQLWAVSIYLNCIIAMVGGYVQSQSAAYMVGEWSAAGGDA